MDLRQDIQLRMAVAAAATKHKPSELEEAILAARIEVLLKSKITSAAAHRRLVNEYPHILVPCPRTLQRKNQVQRERSTSEPSAIGRPKMLSDQQELDIVAYVDLRRDEHSQTLWQHIVIAAEVLFIRDGEAARLVRHGGNVKFSESWARAFMKKHGIKRVAATSDRTVTPAEVAAAATVFFADVRAAVFPNGAGAPPQFELSQVYNMDEFFVLLGPNGSFTYIRRLAGTPVALRQTKLGFTAAVCTNAAGELLFVSACHKGSTIAVHADVVDGILSQHHRSESHFFNEGAVEEWLAEFVHRTRHQEQVCLILDSAPQHNVATRAVQDPARPARKICLITIPPKMTHFFQPADQSIIANLRRYLKSAALHTERQLAVSVGLKESVRRMATTSIPVLRTRWVSWLVAAAKRLTPQDIIHSWTVTGVREALGVPLPEETVIAWKAFAGAPASEPQQVDEAGDDEILAEEEFPAAFIAPIPESLQPESQQVPVPEDPMRAVLVEAKRRGRPPVAPDDPEQRKKAHRAEREVANAAKARRDGFFGQRRPILDRLD
jgi:hypothetical protein